MEDEVYDEIYFDESDRRFHYHCSQCSTSFSGSDEFNLELKVEDHEIRCVVE